MILQRRRENLLLLPRRTLAITSLQATIRLIRTKRSTLCLRKTSITPMLIRGSWKAAMMPTWKWNYPTRTILLRKMLRTIGSQISWFICATKAFRPTPLSTRRKSNFAKKSIRPLRNFVRMGPSISSNKNTLAKACKSISIRNKPWAELTGKEN